MDALHSTLTDRVQNWNDVANQFQVAIDDSNRLEITVCVAVRLKVTLGLPQRRASKPCADLLEVGHEYRVA